MGIKVLVNGGFGRMGQMIVKAMQNHPTFDLVGQTSREYNLKKSIMDSAAQVVVDFTTPEVVYENTKTIISTGAHPVIGTSGLTPEQIKSLQADCEKKQLGGMIIPNFSLGAVLMIKHAKIIAKYMPNVEILEMHHPDKKDSPSGTSLYTAQELSTIPNQNHNTKTEHQTLAGARGANYKGIPIHSIRLPGLLAHQEIIFGSLGETLALRHDSIDRQCFLPGIFLACEKVIALNTMIYGLEGVLD